MADAQVLLEPIAAPYRTLSEDEMLRFHTRSLNQQLAQARLRLFSLSFTPIYHYGCDGATVDKALPRDLLEDQNILLGDKALI